MKTSATIFLAIVLLFAHPLSFSQQPGPGANNAQGGYTFYSFSPNEGIVGETVWIFGQDLLQTQEVRFGGVIASFTLTSGDSISATVPTGAISGNITIENASAVVLTRCCFTVQFTIQSSSGPNGTINPSGSVLVDQDSDQNFVFTPDPGFGVSNVQVDGNPQGALTSYQFLDVVDDHSISVSFAAITDAPVVNAPIQAGATSVSGTGPASIIMSKTGSRMLGGTLIIVYVNSDSVGAVSAEDDGSWTTSGLAALSEGDTVKATATAVDKLKSLFSNEVIVQDITVAPVVKSPITAGATSVSGTGPEFIVATNANGVRGFPVGGTVITVYVNSDSVGVTSVDGGGTWTKTGLAALTEGDSVKATATALNKLTSPFSNAVIVQGPSIEIHAIQGSGFSSPYVGQIVTTANNTVTAISSNGFYMQTPDARADANQNTSEGIFVFTSSAPTASVGDNVSVTGNVVEFRPGGPSSTNLAITEITTPSSIVLLSSGNPLPAAIVLGNGGRTIPFAIIDDDASGDVETSGTFDPATDGINFYETLEGMRVQINNPLAVSFTIFDELWILADAGINATGRTVHGGSRLSVADFNPERIKINGALPGVTLPIVNSGALLNAIVGVINYSSGNFEVLPSISPTVATPSVLTKESTAVIGTSDKLTVATVDVNNLDPGDVAAQITALGDMIANNLLSPDIVIVTSIQDNNGPLNNSVVDASVTFQILINAITTAGGPAYQYRQIDPVDDQDGGEPGGNNRQGFLFNPSRVSFVDIPGGTSTTSTSVSNVSGVPTLSVSPGRIDPTNAAFTTSRKPLVGEFVFNGNKVFVIGTHLNSRGGDHPLFGRYQPPVLSSEVLRSQQTTVIKNFVQSILAIDPNANVVAAGVYNDYEFSNPLTILESGPLNTLVESLPASERYGFMFEGNASATSHILVSNNLLGKLDGFDIVHAASEFNDQITQQDPIVSRFVLDVPPASNVIANPDFESGTAPWVYFTNGTGSYVQSVPGANGSGKAAKVAVTTTGDNVQFYQPGITLAPNTLYRLKFKAYSSNGRDLTGFVARHDAPYTNYGLNNHLFLLTTSWQDFEVQFTTVNFPPPTPSNARLRFRMNGYAINGTIYYIDDVVLEPVVVAPPAATQIRVETAPDGSGAVVPAQTIETGNSLTVYAISRDIGGNFVANVSATTWSLENITPGVLPVHLVPSGDNKSAVFNATIAGSAKIKAVLGVLAPTTSGVITVINPPPPASNILVNGSFESGTGSWSFNTNGVGAFSAPSLGVVGTKAGRVTITTQGSSVQLYQKDIPLTAGQSYRLSFQAFCNTGHDMQASIFRHTSPFTPYGLASTAFLLTNAWASYSVDFVASGFVGNVTDARLRFWVSPYDANGDIYFLDDVALEELPVPQLASGGGTSVAAIPMEFALLQNYPNPFNPTTSIRFALPVDANVTLAVYNVLGQQVAELASGQVTAGYHEIPFDASSLSSGLYIYRLTATSGTETHFTEVRRMLLLK